MRVTGATRETGLASPYRFCRSPADCLKQCVRLASRSSFRSKVTLSTGAIDALKRFTPVLWARAASHRPAAHDRHPEIIQACGFDPLDAFGLHVGVGIVPGADDRHVLLRTAQSEIAAAMRILAIDQFDHVTVDERARFDAEALPIDLGQSLVTFRGGFLAVDRDDEFPIF